MSAHALGLNRATTPHRIYALCGARGGIAAHNDAEVTCRTCRAIIAPSTVIPKMDDPSTDARAIAPQSDADPEPRRPLQR